MSHVSLPTIVGILVMVSIAVKRHHDHCNSYKGKHLTEVVAYSFRVLVHCHNGVHGGVQANRVLATS